MNKGIYKILEKTNLSIMWILGITLCIIIVCSGCAKNSTDKHVSHTLPPSHLTHNFQQLKESKIEPLRESFNQDTHTANNKKVKSESNNKSNPTPPNNTTLTKSSYHKNNTGKQQKESITTKEESMRHDSTSSNAANISEQTDFTQSTMTKSNNDMNHKQLAKTMISQTKDMQTNTHQPQATIQYENEKQATSKMDTTESQKIADSHQHSSEIVATKVADPASSNQSLELRMNDQPMIPIIPLLTVKLPQGNSQ